MDKRSNISSEIQNIFIKALRYFIIRPFISPIKIRFLEYIYIGIMQILGI